MSTDLHIASPEASIPRRVVTGFGMAMRSSSGYLVPHSDEELAQIIAQASERGLTVALRGSGNSYGDAALNREQLVVDTSAMRSVTSWDPASGLADLQPGVTIGDLWRATLADGYWPAVVPGTMLATVAGCAAMNVHGKNNYKVGPSGDHILEFDLLTPGGELLTCSREQHPEIFHAAIGGFGMLGAFTRIRLRLKRVESGLLRVESIRTGTLEENFEYFEEHCPHPDYLVGWLDGTARGAALGRGVLHEANYISAEEDPEGPERTLQVAYQELGKTLMGIPRAHVWRLMRPFMNDLGMRLINSLKYHAARLPARGETYLQSHVAFAFLLDYIPEWRRAYGLEGLIQYQPFLPRDVACGVVRGLLELCHRRHLPPYLLVLKRHRPDPFLLTHALDGYSLAMDFRVTRSNRKDLWNLARELSERVLSAGGRFYFAKDALLEPDHVLRAWGPERIAEFRRIKQQLDPNALLQTDLWRRAFAPQA